MAVGLNNHGSKKTEIIPSTTSLKYWKSHWQILQNQKACMPSPKICLRPFSGNTCSHSMNSDTGQKAIPATERAVKENSD